MGTFKTEQEKFWHGEFGDDYIERNKNITITSSNVAFFSRVFDNVTKIDSVIEFGANIGLNLRAIKQLLPNVKLAAIEINDKATDILKQYDENIVVYKKSILDFAEDKTWDMTLIKGVLIHIAPEELPSVYDKLYKFSNRYICIGEYYNPTPVEISYRGHQGNLFKRDFAGEILDRFPDLRLVNYGFAYHRDNNFPQDDIIWFLMEKTK